LSRRRSGSPAATMTDRPWAPQAQASRPISSHRFSSTRRRSVSTCCKGSGKNEDKKEKITVYIPPRASFSDSNDQNAAFAKTGPGHTDRHNGDTDKKSRVFSFSFSFSFSCSCFLVSLSPAAVAEMVDASSNPMKFGSDPPGSLTFTKCGEESRACNPRACLRESDVKLT
jgi:hypothetical protein